MERLKVLVADDEEDILSVMARQVRQNGYDVLTANDGQEAWEKIQQDSPDIILLDINMPRMDGFAVLKQLREKPPSDKWQPVIIVTARQDLPDIQKGFSLEADHYLTKPCSIEDVLKAVKLMAQLIPQRKNQSDK